MQKISLHTVLTSSDTCTLTILTVYFVNSCNLSEDLCTLEILSRLPKDKKENMYMSLISPQFLQPFNLNQTLSLTRTAKAKSLLNKGAINSPYQLCFSSSILLVRLCVSVSKYVLLSQRLYIQYIVVSVLIFNYVKDL